jgi:hypothetical protein
MYAKIMAPCANTHQNPATFTKGQTTEVRCVLARIPNTTLEGTILKRYEKL